MDFGKGPKSVRNTRKQDKDKDPYSILSIETPPKQPYQDDAKFAGPGSAASHHVPETPPSTPLDQPNSYLGSPRSGRSADVSPITPRTETRLKQAVYSAIPVNVTGAASHAAKARQEPIMSGISNSLRPRAHHNSVAPSEETSVPPNTPDIPTNYLDVRQSWNARPAIHQDHLSAASLKSKLTQTSETLDHSSLLSAVSAAVASSTTVPPNTPDVPTGPDLRMSGTAWFSPSNIPSLDYSSHIGMPLGSTSRQRFASEFGDVPDAPTNTPLDRPSWMHSPTAPGISTDTSVSSEDLGDYSFEQKSRIRSFMQTGAGSYEPGAGPLAAPPNTPADSLGLLRDSSSHSSRSRKESSGGRPRSGSLGLEVNLTPRTEVYLRQTLKTSMETSTTKPGKSKGGLGSSFPETEVPPNTPAMPEESYLSSSITRGSTGRGGAMRLRFNGSSSPEFEEEN